MAFTTVAGLSAARRGLLHFSKNANGTGGGNLGSYWNVSVTFPATGASPGSTTTGVVPTSATAGALAFGDPASGDTAVIVSARLSALHGGGNETIALVADRLWHAGAFTPTSGAYTGLTGTALTRSTDGVCVELYVEITTSLSAAAHTLTITYTNQAGTGSRTGTVTLPASAVANRMFPVTLQAGDTGVAQVTAMSGSASPPTGAFNLVLAKTHAVVPNSLTRGGAAGQPFAYPLLGSVAIPAGACLFFMGIGTGSGQVLAGALEIAYG